jgi:hypothetical protein
LYDYVKGTGDTSKQRNAIKPQYLIRISWRLIRNMTLMLLGMHTVFRCDLIMVDCLVGKRDLQRLKEITPTEKSACLEA